MQYFDHNTMAGSDNKIAALRFYGGGAAVDAYWVIIERIYKDEAPLLLNKYNLAALAMTLNTSPEQVQEWLDQMVDIELLSASEFGYSSSRIDENISAYQAKKEKAAENGRKGGRAKAGAKQSSTKRKATAKGSLTESLPNKTKQNKESFDSLQSQKDSITPNIGGAEEQRTADSAKVKTCPNCSANISKNHQTGRWECSACFETFTAEEIGVTDGT